MIKILESPRDAMQGMKNFIPTENKIKYINQVLKVGFDLVDFGSFVSPKAIPQLSDTAKVYQQLDIKNTKSKLMVIIGNTKGAEIACQYEHIRYIGFPFSISETFLKLNLNTNTEKALQTIEQILHLCEKNQKELIVYHSFAFGNPYGDASKLELLEASVKKLVNLGTQNISLSDVIGIGKAEQIEKTFSTLYNMYPNIEWGFHLHTTQSDWRSKMDAAYEHCQIFDGVLNGAGGCPMANHELVANIETEKIIQFLQEKNENLSINIDEFKKAQQMALEIFPAG